MPQRIAVVIPCYNTTSRCADVVARTMPFADAIVAVDDGSTDDTAEHLHASGCLVLQLSVNSGKGVALAAGFREVLKGSAGPLGARADYVVTFDGDGQHDPADIPRLVDCARRSGADLVLGMRNPAAMPQKNRVGAHFSRLLLLIGTSTFVPDTQSGFRLLSRALVAELIDRVSWKGYESESEALWRTIELDRKVASAEITTIYIDGNRGSQFDASGARAGSLPCSPDSSDGPSAWRCWTLPCSEHSCFGIVEPYVGERRVEVRRRRLSGHVSSRLLGPRETAGARGGPGLVPADFCRPPGSHDRAGRHVVGARDSGDYAKAAGQLVGYLGTFAVVDRVLLRRVSLQQTVRTLSQARG